MKPASHAAAAQRAPQQRSIPEPARRSFLEKALATVIGLFVGVFPFAAGLLVFFDPVIKKRSSGGGNAEG